MSPDSQLRALCTLDRVIRHCVASGLQVVTDAASGLPAHFLVEGQALTLRVVESADKENAPRTHEHLADVRANPKLHL